MQEIMHLLSSGSRNPSETEIQKFLGPTSKLDLLGHKASMNSMGVLNMLENTFKTSRNQSEEIDLFGQFCPWGPNGIRFNNLESWNS